MERKQIEGFLKRAITATLEKDAHVLRGCLTHGSKELYDARDGSAWRAERFEPFTRVQAKKIVSHPKEPWIWVKLADPNPEHRVRLRRNGDGGIEDRKPPRVYLRLLQENGEWRIDSEEHELVQLAIEQFVGGHDPKAPPAPELTPRVLAGTDLPAGWVVDTDGPVAGRSPSWIAEERVQVVRAPEAEGGAQVASVRTLLFASPERAAWYLWARQLDSADETARALWETAIGDEGFFAAHRGGQASLGDQWLVVRKGRVVVEVTSARDREWMERIVSTVIGRL